MQVPYLQYIVGAKNYKRSSNINQTQHFHGKIHEPMNFYLIVVVNDDDTLVLARKKNNNITKNKQGKR